MNYYNEFDEKKAVWLKALIKAILIQKENNSFCPITGGMSGKEPKLFQAISYLRQYGVPRTVHAQVYVLFQEPFFLRKTHMPSERLDLFCKIFSHLNQEASFPWFAPCKWPWIAAFFREKYVQILRYLHGCIPVSKAIYYTVFLKFESEFRRFCKHVHLMMEGMDFLCSTLTCTYENSTSCVHAHQPLPSRTLRKQAVKQVHFPFLTFSYFLYIATYYMKCQIKMWTNKIENGNLGLKGYGDAIVPQVAAKFIQAFLQEIDDAAL